MSVLYKALARAARTRQARQGSSDFSPPEIPYEIPKRRFRVPRAALILPLAVLVVGGGAWFMFGDDFSGQVNEFMAGLGIGSSQPVPAPSVTAPHPAPAPKPQQQAQTPKPVAPGTAAPPAAPAAVASNSASPPVATTPQNPAQTPASSATAAAPAPAATASAPPTVVASNNAPASSPASAAPATAPAPSSPAPAVAPVVTASPPPAPSIAAPAASAQAAPPAIAPATPTAAPATTAEARPARPAAPKATPVPAHTLAPQAVTVPAAAPTPDTNLPAVLARIREQNVEAALSSQVAINHVPAAGTSSRDAGMQISVVEPTQSDRDAADHAFDLLVSGQYQDALSVYNDVLSHQPHMLSAMIGRATALQKIGQNEAARTAYEQVLALDPENREALTNMTALAAAQAPEQAERDLRALQRQHPDFSPIPAGLAQIEANQGNLADAINELKGAVTLTPDNGLYRLDLAVLEDRAGMAADAIVSYQAALDRLGGAGQLPVPIDQIRTRMRFLQGR